MSKAEERALEKYPLMSDVDKEGLEGIEYIVRECDCTSEYNELQEAKQAYFIEGYHRAEKDLELTWEDIREIYCITLNLREHLGASVFGEPLYQEVLKRFKELKRE